MTGVLGCLTLLSIAPAPDNDNTPEPPHRDQPPAVPRAPAPGDDPAREPHITVEASQGTATQRASLAGGDAEHLDFPSVPMTADALDDDPELGTKIVPRGPQAATPPGASAQHVSRLVALTADAALEEVNACIATDIVVFLDSGAPHAGAGPGYHPHL